MINKIFLIKSWLRKQNSNYCLGKTNVCISENKLRNLLNALTNKDLVVPTIATVKKFKFKYIFGEQTNEYHIVLDLYRGYTDKNIKVKRSFIAEKHFTEYTVSISGQMTIKYKISFPGDIRDASVETIDVDHANIKFFNNIITGFLLGFHYEYYGDSKKFIDKMKDNGYLIDQLIEVPISVGYKKRIRTSESFIVKLALKVLLPNPDKINQLIKGLNNYGQSTFDKYFETYSRMVDKIILNARKSFFDNIIKELAESPYIGFYEWEHSRKAKNRSEIW